MESLSPESRALYEILTAETSEIYEAKFAAYRKEKLDAVKVFVTDTRTQLFPDHAGVPNPKRGPAMESSPSSTTRSTAVLSRVVSIDESKSDATKDDLTPGARRSYDLLVAGSAAPTATASLRAPSSSSPIEGTPESADTTAKPEMDLHSVTPSTCSTICLGADTSVTSTPSLPVAVPTSSMTPGLNLVTSTSTSSTLGLGPVVGAIQDEAHMFMADVFGKLPIGQPHLDLHGYDVILHLTCFSGQNQLHVLVALGAFCCELFSIGNTWDCLQYEYLQQWRPPDAVISLAWMGSLINVLWAPNLESRNQLEYVYSFLGTYDQEALHCYISALDVQLQWGCSKTSCLPFHGSYLHGMCKHLPSTLLLGFCCQSSQVDCDSARVVTKGRVVHSLAHKYSEGFLVVIYITYNILDMIIDWESRNMGGSTWKKGSVPTQLLEVYSMLSMLTSNQFPPRLFVIVQWLLPWDPGVVLVQHLLCRSRPRYWVRYMRCVKLETDRPRKCEFRSNNEFMSSRNYPLPSAGHVQLSLQGFAADEGGALFRTTETWGQWWVYNYDSELHEVFPLSVQPPPSEAILLLWDPGGSTRDRLVGRLESSLLLGFHCQSSSEYFDFLWITGKHAEVQFQFSYPPSPANCHFEKRHFLLIGRAQMNVVSICGTSLNLVVYCGYPALNIAHTPYWMLIIVGHLLQYDLEKADALFLLIYWLHVPCLQLLPGLIHAVQGYISSNSRVFLASLNERAAIQQHYICTRILPVAAPKGQNSLHSPQGNPHYSVLMQCLFSQSQLLYGFRFYTAGHILFFCYALVQRKIP